MSSDAVRWWTSFARTTLTKDDEVTVARPELGKVFQECAEQGREAASSLLDDDPRDSWVSGSEIEVYDTIDDSGNLTYCQSVLIHEHAVDMLEADDELTARARQTLELVRDATGS